MLRKGVFPYEYMDSFQKFNETVLPPISDFYSSLTDTNITEDEYQHAQDVWKQLKCKTLGDYQNIYVTTDVVLLADIFQNFRRLSIEFYNIDPAHCYTAPGLAWQAALKMSEVELELLTDPDMYLFVEKGIRGGISVISQRYSQANNMYMESYDRKKESTYIMYLDANNLYGWAMSQALPTHDFKWYKGSIDFMNVEDNAEEGYILEVDLSYPQNLHKSHNEYPLAPEQLDITSEMLSPYVQELAEDLNLKIGKSTKLCPNLLPKTKYIVHYRNLKQYVSLGLQVEKIHRVLRFQQRPWLSSYIQFNTEQRKLAKTSFEKDLFKLLNNSVFGKTMENMRNRTNIDLVHNEKRAKKLVAAPTFHSFKVINEDLVSVERKKSTLVLNRPIYVGFAILDISKTLMYDFHYNHIKNKYGSNARLLFTDTDSLCYEIATKDIYRGNWGTLMHGAP
ncbi:hypothetical protein RF55_20086 [Lasius niger]|uniref:DNA-directed DNA polymerase n=1 Tax=Lasius niger TaxID=67767 RepID=A0A0J7JZE3_LASNI|nr:hypothetical protein RF55_20086 [Lasius niger]